MLSSIDIPMAEGRWVSHGSGCGGVTQNTKAVRRIDLSEVLAMRTKLAEERISRPSDCRVGLIGKFQIFLASLVCM